MTSIFTGIQPDLGPYYIVGDEDILCTVSESVVILSETKLVLKTKYKDGDYNEKELPYSPTNYKDKYYYQFSDINIGRYVVNIFIDYTPNVSMVRIAYYLVPADERRYPVFYLKSFPKVVNNTPPAGFKLSTPKPTTTPASATTTTTPKVRDISTTTKETIPEKSFLDKNLIYIVIVVLFLLAVGTGVFFVIRNRTQRSQNKLIV
jgi:hypothetical protein